MIEGFDPTKLASMMPVTEEIGLKQKKMRRQTEASPSPVSGDMSSFSQEASKELTKDKYESFLNGAKNELSKLDPNAKNFFEQATSSLVSSALEKEFGQEITHDSGYAQMKAVLTKKLTTNIKYKEILNDFLSTVQANTQHQDFPR